MAYFSTQLDSILRKNKQLGRTPSNQTELAGSTGLSQAHISRLISEDQPSISADDLKNICTNVSHDNAERAELIRAHLLDRSVGPGSELIAISISGKPLQLKDQFGPPPLSAKLEHAFEVLRANASNKKVRFILEDLAGLLDHAQTGNVRRKTAPTLKKLKGRAMGAKTA